MRKIMFVATVALLFALVAVPALASFTVLKDNFNSRLGTGTAIVHVRGELYAQIWYKDMDGSRGYTEKDTQLRIRYFRFDQPSVITPVGK